MTRLVPAQDLVSHAADTVAAVIGPRKPTVAIVLGSGLGGLADRIEDAVRVNYRDIPGFHVPTVPGHKGELVAGRLGGVGVIAQSGRFHMYEGHTAGESVLPVRVFAALGATTLIVTNAAGGIRRSFRPGTLMLISDHVNLTGRNPLEGAVLEGETRFPDMTVAYDAGLRDTARRVAAEQGITLDEGVYCALLGPSYETPAEVRMLDRFGIDAVGMSTVHEVIVARARGMRCMGFSTVTNPAAGTTGEPLSHAEVMDVANRVGEKLSAIVVGVLKAMKG